MQHAVEPLTRHSPDREGLVRFLAAFENEERDAAFWRRRLAFWWDENPACKHDSPCGWALRAEGKIVGFLGVIPFEYVLAGKILPAYAATTWRVDREHRNASLPLFVQWHRLGAEAILLDTTPNAETRTVLERFQYRSRPRLQNYFFPLRGGGGGLKSLGFRALATLNNLFLPDEPPRTVTLRDEFEVVQGQLLPEVRSPARLEKRITRAYLRWFCGAPESPRHFVGCVDERGVLTSYLLLQADSYGERPVLSAIDHFTVPSGGRELLGLIRHVLAQPEQFLEGRRADFLLLNFLDEPPFPGKPPGVFVRENPGKHYFSLPKSLASVTKHCVLAEGDYGC